jgi:hypothetical protein
MKKLHFITRFGYDGVTGVRDADEEILGLYAITNRKKGLRADHG